MGPQAHALRAKNIAPESAGFNPWARQKNSTPADSVVSKVTNHAGFALTKFSRFAPRVPSDVLLACKWFMKGSHLLLCSSFRGLVFKDPSQNTVVLSEKGEGYKILARNLAGAGAARNGRAARP